MFTSMTHSGLSDVAHVKNCVSVCCAGVKATDVGISQRWDRIFPLQSRLRPSLNLVFSDLGFGCWSELQTSHRFGLEELFILGFGRGRLRGADQPSGRGGEHTPSLPPPLWDLFLTWSHISVCRKWLTEAQHTRQQQRRRTRKTRTMTKEKWRKKMSSSRWERPLLISAPKTFNLCRPVHRWLTDHWIPDVDMWLQVVHRKRKIGLQLSIIFRIDSTVNYIFVRGSFGVLKDDYGMAFWLGSILTSVWTIFSPVLAV